MNKILLFIGFSLLFFLPVIESYDRTIAMMCLLVGSILISISVARQHIIQFDSLDTLFLGFLVIGAISTIQSISVRDSFTELLRYTAYFLLFVSIRNLPDKKTIFTKFLIPMIVVNSILLTLLYFISANPWLRVLPPPPMTMNLFYPTWGHNRISAFLLFTAPILWNASLTTLNIRMRILYRILTLGFFLVIVLTVARGVLLSLALAFGVYTLFYKKISYSFRLISIVICSTVLIILSASFIYSNFLFPEKFDTWNIRGLYKPARVEQRFVYIQQALYAVGSFPLFGTGLETFRYVSEGLQFQFPGLSWYAHNHFLELFVETGVFGGTVFLLFFLFVFLNLFQDLIRCQNHRRLDGIPLRRDKFGMTNDTGLFIALIATSIHSLIDYDWHYISIFLVFFIAIALMIDTGQKEKVLLR